MFDISRLSEKYSTRILTPSDIELILDLVQKNMQFYKYTEAKPIRKQILRDMSATPPRTDPSDKYYLGFFDGDVLVAIMDLVEGYPTKDIAYIGFFMMNASYQGKGEGSDIVNGVLSYISSTGAKAVHLAIDKGNPQSTHFWQKNGFKILGEVEVHGWYKLVAEKVL